MDSNIIVYLGGSIAGLSYAKAINWRYDAIDRFTEFGIKCLSPMRNRELLEGSKYLDEDEVTLKGYSSKEIFQRDKFDVMKSDILLFNFIDTDNPSIGSLFELAWGYLLNKYCVVILNEKSKYINHPFVQESSSIIFNTLDEAINHIGICYGR